MDFQLFQQQPWLFSSLKPHQNNLLSEFIWLVITFRKINEEIQYEGIAENTAFINVVFLALREEFCLQLCNPLLKVPFSYPIPISRMYLHSRFKRKALNEKCLHKKKLKDESPVDYIGYRFEQSSYSNCKLQPLIFVKSQDAESCIVLPYQWWYRPFVFIENWNWLHQQRIAMSLNLNISYTWNIWMLKVIW